MKHPWILSLMVSPGDTNWVLISNRCSFRVTNLTCLPFLPWLPWHHRLLLYSSVIQQWVAILDIEPLDVKNMIQDQSSLQVYHQDHLLYHILNQVYSDDPNNNFLHFRHIYSYHCNKIVVLVYNQTFWEKHNILPLKEI